ncbi:MAG: hypothetical protein ACD_79C00783G0005 [uncultured bacterium]|nr:MAG: hypothetical protein ACD_79C00783G0005 [uncultured bacterium]
MNIIKILNQLTIKRVLFTWTLLVVIFSVILIYSALNSLHRFSINQKNLIKEVFPLENNIGKISFVITNYQILQDNMINAKSVAEVESFRDKSKYKEIFDKSIDSFKKIDLSEINGFVKTLEKQFLKFTTIDNTLGLKRFEILDNFRSLNEYSLEIDKLINLIEVDGETIYGKLNLYEMKVKKEIKKAINQSDKEKLFAESSKLYEGYLSTLRESSNSIRIEAINLSALSSILLMEENKDNLVSIKDNKIKSRYTIIKNSLDKLKVHEITKISEDLSEVSERLNNNFTKLMSILLEGEESTYNLKIKSIVLKEEFNALMHSSNETINFINEVLNNIEQYSKLKVDTSLQETSIIVMNSRFVLFISGGVIIFFIIAVGFLVIKRIIGPLNKTINALNQISKGYLKTSVGYDRNDEIGILVNDLNKMTTSLYDIVAKVKGHANEISDISNEMLESSELMLNGANQQTENSKLIFNISEDLSASTTVVMENISSVTSSIERTAQLAKDGEEVVNSSLIEIREISDSVKESEDIINKLSEYSNKIGAVTNVIKDVVDRTNLLSLNAAIEAARAGKYGRGFAIVADEVKSLAEKTILSTVEINKTIKQIQSEVKKSASSMIIVSDKVTQGVNFSQKAGASLRDIVKDVENLHEMIKQIAFSSIEMSTVTHKIKKHINNISDVSNETFKRSERISQMASYFNELSTNLKEMVEHFKL